MWVFTVSREVNQFRIQLIIFISLFTFKCQSGTSYQLWGCSQELWTLSNMRGNFLILLVTANTTYTTFDVVYTEIMFYTQQVLYRDTSCISTDTYVYVMYSQLHPVYAQIRVVS